MESLMDDQVDHFVHYHPLKLIKIRDDRFIDGRLMLYKFVNCKLCRQEIQLSSGLTVYTCTNSFTCFGDVFLHKTCAKLKKTLYFPFHPFHPLSSIYAFYVSSCDLCDRRLISDYYYRCEPCKFAVCCNCVMAKIAQNEAATALLEESVSRFTHEGHNPQHTLILQSRPAAFHCNACQTEKKDMFYQCDDCDFWIHKSCAMLTPTIDRPHYHRHPLSLVFSLPEKFYNYKYTCEVCNKRIMQTEWTYHCANCRYFIHIKCVPNPDQQRLGANVEEEANDSDILHFPMSYPFTDPLKLLHSKNDRSTTIAAGGGDDERSVEIINHWSHDHPLFLTVVPQGKNNIMPTDDIGSSSSSIDDQMITVCHCCVRPLSSSPYYTCKHHGCSFTLHKYCVELPRTLQHPFHPYHPLHLVNTDALGLISYLACQACEKICNAFLYKCETCTFGFNLDVNCAFLPKVIKHEFHKQHHLVQHVGRVDKSSCAICEESFASHVGYSCDVCNFRLDLHCALRSPRSLPHRYCKGHEVPLMYPPIEDHPEDFYCEICEQEMHPLLPLYYCGKCPSKNSFHIRCLSRRYWFENYLMEGVLSVRGHNHPLTPVRRKKPPKEVCFGCNGDINGYLFVECRTGNCPYCLCLDCLKAIIGLFFM